MRITGLPRQERGARAAASLGICCSFQRKWRERDCLEAPTYCRASSRARHRPPQQLAMPPAARRPSLPPPVSCDGRSLILPPPVCGPSSWPAGELHLPQLPPFIVIDLQCGTALQLPLGCLLLCLVWSAPRCSLSQCQTKILLVIWLAIYSEYFIGYK